MRLVRELRSRLQYKIIVPFLLLTLLVALAGAAVALTLVTSSIQERLDNQLAQVARSASDSVVRQEQNNLQFLREVSFAPANPETGSLAVADALARRDKPALEQALDPYFRSGVIRDDLGLDRLIVFDTGGVALLDWEQPRGPDAASDPITRTNTILTGQWFVQAVLEGQEDGAGDKHAGLVTFAEGGKYLFTVAPVKQGDQLVGGVLIARGLDELARDLRMRAQADIVAVYDGTGTPIASTFEPNEGLAKLAIDAALTDKLIRSQTDSTLPEEQQVKAVYTVPVNQRDYQFAYSVLKVRNAVVGVVSVALARDYVVGPWATALRPISVLTLVLMLAIIGLGVWVARMITRPLEELVATAREVTEGNLSRRSGIDVHDEVGELARSFNTMTDSLVNLSSRSQAIVESIGDAVIVCDMNGKILVSNRAAEQLVAQMGLERLPGTFGDLPLMPLAEDDNPFGVGRSADLRMVGERVMRLKVAPVLLNDARLGDVRLGDVYLLQDLTEEAAVDRARTSFIATISHEMRTPLTVMRGYSDLMLRGLVGKLSDEQSDMIESMRQQVNGMTLLINNMITVSSLDSGSLQTYLEPMQPTTIIDEMIWNLRTQISAKGLEIVVDMPESLPPVLADREQLRQILFHLIDNARRYTTAGTITVSAHPHDGLVQIDVRDTGCGIDPALQAQIFDRFIRGDEGINSPERGIGLGLAIVKQLVERQGGTIWFESERGRGSTFSFTLRQSDGPPDHDAGNTTKDLAAAA